MGIGHQLRGVLAFLYADLIVLPLLDAYRRYGWRMAAYIGVVFYVTMVLASLVMDVGFQIVGLGWAAWSARRRRSSTAFSVSLA